MNIQIKHRYTNEVLYEAKGAANMREAVEAARRKGVNLRGANLAGAHLRGSNLAGANLAGTYLGGANLAGANLAGTYLGGANLGGANLRGANLGGAHLVGANLGGANLVGARGFKPEFIDDLRILLDQVGKIRAYKLITADLESPINGDRIIYEIGSTVEANADTDEAQQCGPEINLATLPWCLRNWQPGYQVLLCEFTQKDIAAIPHGTDGKFRVHKARVIREVDISELVGEEVA